MTKILSCITHLCANGIYIYVPKGYIKDNMVNILIHVISGVFIQWWENVK